MKTDHDETVGLFVYTKDNCPQCRMTKNLLEAQGLVSDVDFTEININAHPEIIDYLKEKGYQAVPVIELRYEDSFAGFKPDTIRSFVSTLKAMKAETQEIIKSEGSQHEKHLAKS